jgi:hypothetical protein
MVKAMLQFVEIGVQMLPPHYKSSRQAQHSLRARRILPVC